MKYYTFGAPWALCTQTRATVKLFGQNTNTHNMYMHVCMSLLCYDATEIVLSSRILCREHHLRAVCVEWKHIWDDLLLCLHPTIRNALCSVFSGNEAGISFQRSHTAVYDMCLDYGALACLLLLSRACNGWTFSSYHDATSRAQLCEQMFSYVTRFVRQKGIADTIVLKITHTER